MSTVKERIATLRSLMTRSDISAYIVPTSDYHQSEIVGNYFRQRVYITGFTGSAGTAVIATEDAGLWTDGRYFIQAEQQLAGSGVKLMKMREPGVPEVKDWIAQNVPEGSKVAANGRVISETQSREYKETFKDKNISIDYSYDLISEFWEDRPSVPADPAFYLEEKYTGEGIASKLERYRAEINKLGADTGLEVSLDNICWLLNVRGHDVPLAPLLLSYAIVGPDKVDFYTDEAKISSDIRKILEDNNVVLHPYDAIYEDICKLSGAKVLADPDYVNCVLFESIPESCTIVEATSPIVLMKALKNPVELENIRASHIKDGVATTKFMHWVKTHYDKEYVTELSAEEVFRSFRAEQEGYINDNFESICGYEGHAAIMHYYSKPETDCQLKEGIFLTDTGGVYYEGSTDISRTFILGSLDDARKHLYTATARATINLSRAVFLHGCYGFNLDILARGPIWDMMMDYKCGTGHGVGYLLNVHEGPHSFRWNILKGLSHDHILEEGMVVTIEPGIYEEGYFGARTENEVVVRKAEANDYGQFMYFETVTMAPFDLDGIIPEEMQPDEREWLNNYHKEVYEKISPHLNDEEREWLKHATRAI